MQKKAHGWFDPRNTPLGSCGHHNQWNHRRWNFRIAAKSLLLIGTYSLFAFVACALVVTLIILASLKWEVDLMRPAVLTLYARTAFGPTVGFEIGWLMWLARLYGVRREL